MLCYSVISNYPGEPRVAAAPWPCTYLWFPVLEQNECTLFESHLMCCIDITMFEWRFQFWINNSKFTFRRNRPTAFIFDRGRSESLRHRRRQSAALVIDRPIVSSESAWWRANVQCSLHEQESCAIAKMTARCALYKYIVSRCGDMAIRYYPRWRRPPSW